ncbi:MAG TPA: YceI family protein [Streptosporangiaceae bacterium]|jgi:polyisoprenoid-binding protein YceI
MTATTPAIELDAGTWEIDTAHSEIAFSVRHLMTTVRGSFTRFTGRIEVADDPLESSVRAEIEMASIETRNAERDEHVRSSEILDVAHHPDMTFTATGVEEARRRRHAAQQNYVVAGELTVRGVTRPITLLTEYFGISEDPWGGTRAGFTATATINRKDFGVEFNIPLTGDRAVLGDEIDVQLEIQAVRSGD